MTCDTNNGTPEVKVTVSTGRSLAALSSSEPMSIASGLMTMGGSCTVTDSDILLVIGDTVTGDR